MPISMARSAHYVTQSSVYDVPLLGPLTNRRITAYAKRGYYGSTGLLSQSKAKAKSKLKPKTLSAVDSLLKGLF